MRMCIVVLYSIPLILIPKLLGIVSKWKSPTTILNSQICIGLISIELFPTNEQSSYVVEGNPEWNIQYVSIKTSHFVVGIRLYNDRNYISLPSVTRCLLCVKKPRTVPYYGTKTLFICTTKFQRSLCTCAVECRD